MPVDVDKIESGQKLYYLKWSPDEHSVTIRAIRVTKHIPKMNLFPGQEHIVRTDKDEIFISKTLYSSIKEAEHVINKVKIMWNKSMIVKIEDLEE